MLSSGSQTHNQSHNHKQSAISQPQKTILRTTQITHKQPPTQLETCDKTLQTRMQRLRRNDDQSTRTTNHLSNATKNIRGRAHNCKPSESTTHIGPAHGQLVTCAQHKLKKAPASMCEPAPTNTTMNPVSLQCVGIKLRTRRKICDHSANAIVIVIERLCPST